MFTYLYLFNTIKIVMCMVLIYKYTYYIHIYKTTHIYHIDVCVCK